MALLIDELTSSGLLASLYGTKRTIERQFRLKDVFFLMSNDKKSPLRRRKDPSYPYAYFQLSSLAIVRDQMNNRAIQRHGMSDRLTNFHSVNGATNSTINKFFLFQATISAELHYFGNSVPDIIKFIEAFLILGSTSSLNFFLKINESCQWLTRIEVTGDEISIPDYDLEDPVNPAASEIVIPFVIHTHLGFLRDVARVNSETQTITFLMGTPDEEVENIPKVIRIENEDVDLSTQGF